MRCIFFAALIVLGDQWVKAAVERSLDEYESVPFIPGIMEITCRHNPNGAFGMFEGMRVPLLILTAAVCIALTVYLLTDREKLPVYRVSLTMILGGALGNAIDRIIDADGVTDMFKTLFVRFAVFNVADCFITVGGIILCAYILLSTFRDGKKNTAEVRNDDPDSDG